MPPIDRLFAALSTGLENIMTNAPADIVATPAEVAHVMIALGITMVSQPHRLGILACMIPQTEASEEEAVATVRRAYAAARGSNRPPPN